MAYELAIHSSGTSLNEALDIPVSVAEMFFKSQAFKNWKAHKEAEGKLQVGIGERLNTLITAINGVSKTVAATAGRR